MESRKFGEDKASQQTGSQGCSSILQDSSVNPKTLQYQRSTKRLINRYEAMTPEPHSIVMSSVRSSRGLDPPKLVLHPFGGKKGKGNSPIRQSIRNFLSVFKKGKIPGMEKEDTAMLVTSTRSISPGYDILAAELPPEPSGLVAIKPHKLSVLHSGPLLYLSSSSSLPSHFSSPIFPVWTTCTVTLNTDDILITWLTAGGNPSVHTISLTQCTDVRSLSLSQISLDEKALLPSNGDVDGLKVFEILFEGQGKCREVFAASSVQERSRWVSALW
jgi:hypothetical protein